MAIATIAAINGSGAVYAVNAQGVSRIVKAGDALQKGETIRTTGNATVELMMEDGKLMTIGEAQAVKLDGNVAQGDDRPSALDSAVTATTTSDTVIQALDRGGDLNETLDATAAGLGGGGGGGGSSFVTLLRVSEGVNGNQYGFNFNGLGVPPVTPGVAEPDVVAAVAAATASTTPTVPTPPTEPDPEDPVDPEEPVDPQEPVDDGDGNNGHGNNTDGQDDSNPGQGGGGPNSGPKDGEDEDEGNPGNQGDTTPGVGVKSGQDADTDADPQTPVEPAEEVKPNSGAGNGGEGGLTEQEADDKDPGNSGAHNNAPAVPPGLVEEEESVPMPAQEKEHQDNGWGNGDDTAPGNSLENNNAENNNSGESLDPKDLLKDEEESLLPSAGHEPRGGGAPDVPPGLDLANEADKILAEAAKGNPHNG